MTNLYRSMCRQLGYYSKAIDNFIEIDYLIFRSIALGHGTTNEVTWRNILDKTAGVCCGGLGTEGFTYLKVMSF